MVAVVSLSVSVTRPSLWPISVQIDRAKIYSSARAVCKEDRFNEITATAIRTIIACPMRNICIHHILPCMHIGRGIIIIMQLVVSRLRGDCSSRADEGRGLWVSGRTMYTILARVVVMFRLRSRNRDREIWCLFSVQHIQHNQVFVVRLSSSRLRCIWPMASRDHDPKRCKAYNISRRQQYRLHLTASAIA